MIEILISGVYMVRFGCSYFPLILFYGAYSTKIRSFGLDIKKHRMRIVKSCIFDKWCTRLLLDETEKQTSNHYGEMLHAC
jgi:hypothetical protein